MKRIISILLLIFILCGCAAKPSEKPPVDDTTPPNTTAQPGTTSPHDTVPSPEETTRTCGTREIVFSAFRFKSLNAVALTWGEPIPESDADYDEVTSKAGVTFLPVRVTYDEIFYSSFEMRNFSTHPFDIPDYVIMGHLDDFIYVPKDAINQFSAGKKYLLFLEKCANNFCLDAKAGEDGTIEFLRPIVEIVDGKIRLSGDFNNYHHLAHTIRMANLGLKEDGYKGAIFEDGMPISDFGAYVDSVLPYHRIQ